jgi:3-oxosteroid 1-dehydrogenase
VGAGLRNMNQAWGMPCYNMGDEKVGMFAQDRAKPGCILVNKHGERFLNESANYETIQRAFYRWDVVGSTGSYRNIPGFAIVDANHLNKYGFVGGAPGEESPLLAKADTLRELASKLGVDPDGLEKTVEEFNGYAKDGHDPVFHRGETEYDKFWSGFYDPESPVLVPVETPPFYGSPEVWPGGIGTKGGLAVNEHGQCLTPFNEVVPRLYASGNNSGVGAPGADYGGAGGTMGPGMVFAYIGGNHAAEEEPWG